MADSQYYIQCISYYSVSLKEHREIKVLLPQNKND